MINSDSFLDLGDSFYSDGAPLSSCMSVPVLLSECLLGVVSLYSSEPNRFTGEDKLLLESHLKEFVNDLGSRSQTLDQGSGGHPIAPSASLDPVFLHGQLYGQRVALVVLELRWNHVLPETASQELAIGINRVVREALRSGDLTIRTSEREIVVVLPQSDGRMARGTAQRIGACIQERVFALESGFRLQVSARHGVSISPDDGTSLDSLLRHARRSLYNGAREDQSSAPTVH